MKAQEKRRVVAVWASRRCHSLSLVVGVSHCGFRLRLCSIDNDEETDAYLFVAEGSWDAVMGVIGQAHTMLHEKGVVRIQTDIRVGSRLVPLFLDVFALLRRNLMGCGLMVVRTDKVQSFGEKVTAVEKLLAADEKET